MREGGYKRRLLVDVDIIQNQAQLMFPQKDVGFPIFESLTPDFPLGTNFAETILQTKVKLEENATSKYQLSLKDDLIVLSSCGQGRQTALGFVRLTFSLKFEKIFTCRKKSHIAERMEDYELKGFKLLDENANEISFFIQLPSLTRMWIKHLARSINQTGFHQQFKPFRRLGKGASAIVYEVIRLEDGERFAAKVLSKDAINNNSQKFQGFKKEIQILRNLYHPNLLKIEGIFESDVNYYILMEHLKGGNLLEYLRRGPITTIDEIRNIMRALMLGLAELERSGIVHRDVKLQNIMFRDTKCKEPVIVDFGLAVYSEDQEYSFVRCGTPGFISPDIFQMEKQTKITPISDVFSIGVVFHILLLRKSLFLGKEVRTIYENNKNLNFNLNQSHYDSINSSAMDLLKKMLAIDSKDRIKASECLQHDFLQGEFMEEEKTGVSPAYTSCSF